MQSHASTATATAKEEWARHWPMVLTCALGMAIASAYFHIVGAMVRPLEAAYGWTRAEVSFAVTVYSLIVPFSSVAAGMLADRFGPRRVVLVGIGLYGVSFALFGLAGPEIWTWYAAAALFAALAQGVSPVIWTMAVVRNFSAGRGLALAVSLSGSGLMVAIVPSMVLLLVTELGVRGAFFAMAAAASLVLFLPALLFYRPAGDVSTTAAQRKEASSLLPGASVAEALRSKQFWKLTTGLALVATTVGVFVVHFQSMLIDSGLTAAQAASSALLMGPMMILGRLGTGYLFDRLPTPLVSAVAFGIPTLACLMMLGFNGTLVMAMICAGVIGLGMGAEVDVVSYVASRYFGLKRYGVLFAILLGIYGTGIGIGSSLAGVAVGRFGSYDPLLMVLAVACLVAAFLVGSLGQPRAYAAPPAPSH